MQSYKLTNIHLFDSLIIATLLTITAKANEFKTTSEFLLILTEFKNEKIKYHMKEMKQLLEVSLKSQSKGK